LGKDKLQISYWFTVHIHDLSGKGIKAIVDEFLTGPEGKKKADRKNGKSQKSNAPHFSNFFVGKYANEGKGKQVTPSRSEENRCHFKEPRRFK
jgi:hypothetical protein